MNAKNVRAHLWLHLLKDGGIWESRELCRVKLLGNIERQQIGMALVHMSTAGEVKVWDGQASSTASKQPKSQTKRQPKGFGVTHLCKVPDGVTVGQLLEAAI